MCGAAACALSASMLSHFSTTTNASAPYFVCTGSAGSASTAAPYSMQPFSARTAGTIWRQCFRTSSLFPGLAVMTAMTWIMLSAPSVVIRSKYPSNWGLSPAQGANYLVFLHTVSRELRKRLIRIGEKQGMEPARESAVLFAELIGTAELYAQAGDTLAHETISKCAQRLGQAAGASGAELLKTIGSRLMLLAPSADAAAAAAVAMHMSAWEFPREAESLALGVGFHYGPVIRDNGDVFGDTVNLAARLVEQAARGQVLFAADNARHLSPRYKRLMRRLYDHPLKGRSEDVPLCELVWRADQQPTMYPVRGAPAQLQAKLRLRYHGRKVILRDGSELFTIGRDADCALVVADGEVSRHHCTIQRRSDHFVLSDQSTNGTYVTVDGETEVLLKREELTLRRRGWISLGAPHGQASEALEFSCD